MQALTYNEDYFTGDTVLVRLLSKGAYSGTGIVDGATYTGTVISSLVDVDIDDARKYVFSTGNPYKNAPRCQVLAVLNGRASRVMHTTTLEGQQYRKPRIRCNG